MLGSNYNYDPHKNEEQKLLFLIKKELELVYKDFIKYIFGDSKDGNLIVNY